MRCSTRVCAVLPVLNYRRRRGRPGGSVRFGSVPDRMARPVVLDLSPRPMRGTDLKFGPVVLGTMTFGTQLDELESAKVVHAARGLGISRSRPVPGGKAPLDVAPDRHAMRRL